MSYFFAISLTGTLSMHARTIFARKAKPDSSLRPRAILERSLFVFSSLSRSLAGLAILSLIKVFWKAYIARAIFAIRR
jgi:hypothetical protein